MHSAKATVILPASKGTRAAQALAEPGATDTFTIRLAGGGEAPHSHVTAIPLDDVLISGAIWAEQRGPHAGTRAIRAHVVVELREGGQQPSINFPVEASTGSVA